MYNFCFSGNPIFENKKGADKPTKAEVKNMSKKGKIRVALGSLLALTLVVTCVAVYQSGSKSRANEKEFVKENEEDIVDQAIKTEEREDAEEVQDVNTTEVEGTREVEESTQENTEEPAPETPEEEPEQVPAPEAENTSAQVAAPEINFTESSLMEWPVNGQVVLDYNMDNTIYFPTLNVYKLNPAIAISSEVGSPVAAVANGKIVSVVNNEETGQTVTVDMGNGYQAVYGQLKDVPFQAEEYVSAGSVLGYISEPTKYYTKEGANLYFALSKDGIPLDPMQYLP